MTVSAPVKPAAWCGLFDAPTRFLFFTGKGGVGKTSLACATAVRLADRGRRVLLVSTDPASNLDEVLGVRLAPVPRAVPGVAGLEALNLDPTAAAAAYRERLVGPYRGKLPPSVVRSMEEQLSGACTTEIAAFDEFSRLLGEAAATTGYAHVIFDTAPTGHTLRLMQLPAAWTGFFANNTTGNSCLGPLAGLEQQRRVYAAAVNAITQAELTTLILVSRATHASLAEAARTQVELAALGVRNQRLLINGVFPARSTDPIAQAVAARDARALAAHAPFIAQLPHATVALRPNNQLGIDALRHLALESELPAAPPVAGAADPTPAIPGLAALIDDLEREGRGVIMTMGKGGVGKTTLAAAIAVELARRGHPVHLSTTDPAAHVADVAGTTPGFEVGRIDPVAETTAYASQVLATAGQGLDANARAMLEEDLRSPCTEEVAVFRAFARVVAEGMERFVVLDTAPTGHTLLLLDATESYHREVARRGSALPEEVRQLLPRLRDKAYTRVLLVTLPEATPVHEAAALQQDLRRAQIEPYAWIINQSLAATCTTDPLLAARGRNEHPYLLEVVHHLASRACLVPWIADDLRGAAALARLTAGNASLCP